MQGLNEDNFDPEQLLDEQHQWEKKHPGESGEAQPEKH
jgi:phospholipid-binding lipoprotein MlaA